MASKNVFYALGRSRVDNRIPVPPVIPGRLQIFRSGSPVRTVHQAARLQDQAARNLAARYALGHIQCKRSGQVHADMGRHVQYQSTEHSALQAGTTDAARRGSESLGMALLLKGCRDGSGQVLEGVWSGNVLANDGRDPAKPGNAKGAGCYNAPH